jgi:hypothetical protein
VWRWCQDQNIQCIKEWHLNVTHRAKWSGYGGGC